MNKTEVVVMGAGAIGLSIAYELSRRGRQVTIVERDRLIRSGAESDGCDYRSASSWAASGILPPANFARSTDPIDRLRGLSHQLFPQWVASLKELTGVDSRLERSGGWYLSDTVGEAAAMAGMVSFWRDLGISCDRVELSEFEKREPALADWSRSTPSAKVWWAEDEYQIHTPSYLKALLEACRQAGATVLDRTEVEQLDESDQGVLVRCKQVGEAGPKHPPIEVHAEQAVVCGGVWSGRFSARLRMSKSLIPVRGQILMLKTDSRILNGIVNYGHRYLVPRFDGSVLVGSSEEEVGAQHGTTPAVLADLREFANRMCPALAQAREMMAWSGLRPLTFDGFPMCGKLPGSESIFVAAGHFRSGIHLSPGTAVCLADRMTGQTPPVSLDAFSVGKQQQTPGE